MNISGYVNLVLDPSRVTVQKGRDKRTQILFGDLERISVIAETSELLVYLDNLTEQVRQIDCEQNTKEL